nr:type ISP restriction/modification enzyme [Curtobacterium albidum]
MRGQAYDEHDKGDRFERLMQAYLRTEPQYADLYDEVWLWMEYPRRDGRKDTGIDLVARTRATGEYTAIQCKFYAETTQVTKAMLDSFLSASGKYYEGEVEFTGRVVISTTDNWGKNAEEAVENQNPPVSRLRVQDLDESSVDWSQFSLAKPGELVKKKHKEPFTHQKAAIAKVIEGFETADRGKLIMACGTGKTYTSLQIVEQQVPKGGTVLFLVPSIALLSQTLKEWTIEAKVPLRSFAVCSDVSVGKRKDEEDTAVVDLAYPATTNTAKLVEKFTGPVEHPDTVTVIFSTYQSIEVVAAAQKAGIPEFDLIVCDEAHRTTGVILQGDDKVSPFVRVHDQSFIQGKKRLYMTATPRIYSDTAHTKAEEAGAAAIDMNRPEFGEEFHRLSFGEAVSIGRLTDYKVLVLAVDESYVSKRFQGLLADEHNELTLDDAAKIVGCWNGLSKRALTADEFRLDPDPMKRAVAFARNIKESKKLASIFEQVVAAEIEAIDRETDGSASDLLEVEVHHVDGTFNVLERNKELDWLKQDAGEAQARILTNAKCLSEGVDVPSLDAVMFLNPRDSVVDVVQSVGRVMRKLQGKNYGYVILPIGVPSGVDPSVALNDNKKYRTVWQVLQALRAHDERFDAEVNKIDLTRKTDKLQVGIIGKGGMAQDRNPSEADYGSVQLDMPELEIWRDAILAKIVDKVGERRYWETWAKDVAGIAEDHIARITALVAGSDAMLQKEFARFLKGLQDNLNPFITERDAVEMLSQHLITKPVFDALFKGYAFSEHNPVSLVMQGMIDALEGQNLDKETDRLEKFYNSVRLRAADIDDVAAKQTIVKELYERFFRTAFAGTSERLGIVYTPNEIVDFIIHSVDDALGSEFGARITDEGIHVLDPFTGTGTFIVRLLQSGLIKPDDLVRKYRYELHANELVLLAYYVAAINIEETFHAIAGSDYESFDGIVLTDTFQMTESGDVDELPGFEVFEANNRRVEAQKDLNIRVVVGNPPWSVGQESGNDQSQNVRYPTLDARVRESYSSERGRGGNNAVYDSYIRAIRWGSDRIGSRGILAYVSNGGFIDGSAAAEMRQRLADEFSSIYVFNLRGNTRTMGEEARREGGQTFGAGSRATVAIYLFIKNPDAAQQGRVFYRDIGDYLTRDQKLGILQAAGTYSAVEWTEIQPDAAGDWINQRSADFLGFTPLGSKRAEDAGSLTIFSTYSRGLETGRDAWVYNFSKKRLLENVRRLASNYNILVTKATDIVKMNPGVTRRQAASAVIDLDPKKISWTLSLKNRLASARHVVVDETRVTTAMYRPFNLEYVFYDRQLNHILGRLPATHPLPTSANWGFVVTSPSSHFPIFSALATKFIPDLHMLDTGQFFPRYTYAEAIDEDANQLAGLDASSMPGGREDNITDQALELFQAKYGPEVTKDDVFYYVYGVLNSTEYVQRFSSDLKKVLPRIPFVRDFSAFADAGRELANLHMNYETGPLFPLTETTSADPTYAVTQLRYGKIGKIVDKSTIIYNADVTLSGIPDDAHEYMIGSRSAVDWIIERYRVRTDKKSGLVNDPNDWIAEHGDDRYLVELISRVVFLSVETVRIVKSLPPLEVID